MRRFLVVLIVATAALVGGRAYAHHSFVHVMVKEKDGNMVRYAVEWGGAGQLGGQGVTRETLKPGDHVIISGSPGRNPKDHRIRMVTLHRPKDGFGWGKKPGETVD